MTAYEDVSLLSSDDESVYELIDASLPPLATDRSGNAAAVTDASAAPAVSVAVTPEVQKSLPARVDFLLTVAGLSIEQRCSLLGEIGQLMDEEVMKRSKEIMEQKQLMFDQKLGDIEAYYAQREERARKEERKKMERVMGKKQMMSEQAEFAEREAKAIEEERQKTGQKQLLSDQEVRDIAAKLDALEERDSDEERKKKKEMLAQFRAEQALIPDNYIVKTRAIYAFSAINKDYIDLRVNDVVYVTKKNDFTCWTGVCRGKTGFFPAAFVKKSL